jgi:hypothetical protein
MATLNLTINQHTTFGPIICHAKRKVDGVLVPAPLAGYRAYAEARKGNGSPVVIDFTPVIEPDDTEGIITLPEIPHEETKHLPPGSIPWSLILETPTGKRFRDPIFTGTVSINQITTQPA